MTDPAAHRASVLVVEDERRIRRFVRTALEAEHCHVAEAETGRRALLDAAARKPDLVVLDLGLPDMDGIDVVRALRGGSAVPILILSARSEERAKVDALDAGADDYLTKPFGVAELQARVRALLRRAAGTPDGVQPRVTLGELEIDLARRQVSRAGAPLHLTPIEYRLLSLLAANLGRVLTHRQLLREVWGPGHAEDTHYLRVYMAGLRRKIEAEPSFPRHLITESGVGYRLVE